MTGPENRCKELTVPVRSFYRHGVCMIVPRRPIVGHTEGRLGGGHTRHLVVHGLYRLVTWNATSFHWNTCLTSACSPDRDRRVTILFQRLDHGRDGQIGAV